MCGITSVSDLPAHWQISLYKAPNYDVEKYIKQRCSISYPFLGLSIAY